MHPPEHRSFSFFADPCSSWTCEAEQHRPAIRLQGTAVCAAFAVQVLRVLPLPLLTVCWKTGVSCRSQKTGSFPILALSAYLQQLKQHPSGLLLTRGPGGRGHARRTCE